MKELKELHIQRTEREGNKAAWLINNEYVEYVMEAHEAAERILGKKVDYLLFKGYLLKQ